MVGEKVHYGFKWWLYPLDGRFAWMALGVRRQRLMAFPEQNLIAVFPERIGDRVPSA